MTEKQTQIDLKNNKRREWNEIMMLFNIKESE